ncbi:DUF2970 domain-containing protein [Pokkaliibacter sp. MBI-7]|uniref:DUF2970 domain-containing protein n=1 Tax=Pokkaliibacter sp. MBI-7 TaxID=3040600 RepID=UPI002449E836|nr:DUF2970 domain-containing protein [Pokkaliibacter sp. MBI-7]MDH2431564.1 DUF2970 domain-containing protein [Pokkaliibacter sp. MBI-7]
MKQTLLDWWRIVRSVLSAFLGVQNEHRRQRDFASDSPWPFIIAGVVLALILVIALVLIVHVVLASG